MEPRRLLIAALILVGLSGALWWSNEHPDKPVAPDEPPKMLEIPPDQITKLEIRRMGAELVQLEKVADWKLKSPVSLQADQDAVSGLVSTLAVLTPERLVDDRTTDFGAYGLTSPLISVLIGRKDGETHTVQIGDMTPSGGSSYARLEGESKLYTVPASIKAQFEKTWRDLRDKRLLTVDSEKVTRVELTTKGGPIEIGKNEMGVWTIVRPRAMRADNFVAEELIRKLKDAKLEVVNDTEEEAAIPGKFAAGTLLGVVKVTSQKATQQIEVRQGKEKEYYAKSSAMDGVYKTTAELGDGLAKNLDDFRNKKLFDFGFNQPERVEVKQDGTTYLFTKTGTEWKRDGKKVDPGAVQQIVDRLRELSATKFTESPAGAVVAEYTVGKESVTVAKQGDIFVARRGNEPDVYVLDGKAVSEMKDLAAGAKEITPTPPAATK